MKSVKLNFLLLKGGGLENLQNDGICVFKNPKNAELIFCTCWDWGSRISHMHARCFFSPEPSDDNSDENITNEWIFDKYTVRPNPSWIGNQTVLEVVVW